MSVTWTKAQREVIDTRDTNLLVSAAAGSGKTAVLVERILSLITEEDEEKRIDVDRLLITTFTKAAAGEMKDRIGRALNERLRLDPENEWLLRQEALVRRAQITTIHGFCLYVIRNYFHVIGLNPSFRIADEGEMRLLKQDVAEQIIEEAHEEKAPAFVKFAECYGSGNRGGGLEDMILNLYEYASASPRPEKWLEGCADMYRLPPDASWDDFAGTKGILLELKGAVSDCRRQIKKARELAACPAGPCAYDPALASDEEFLNALENCGRLEDFEELLQEASWARLPSRRAKVMAGADEGLCERVMEMRSAVKDTVKAMEKQYFQIPLEISLAQLWETAENVQTYVNLTLAFMERLDKKKRQKNILDFSDQEHLALKILTKEENGSLVPSETAAVFAGYFAEIMVDEYQDSNLVQEAILNSIAGKNNRFMVGDVKQSIYRFRQAEPGLFLQKYHQYEEGAGGVRIDLHQNFRSRGTVLDSVNEVFEKIMRGELGGIVYDEAAALKAGADYPANAGDRTELMLLASEEWEELKEECHLTKQEAEAHLIAGRIRRMLEDKEQVTEEGKLRPVRLGDIVILLRTMSGWSETFVRVLKDEGIPASAQSREGYFETMEVEALLSYLRMLDNPTQEIPVAAAMHSLLGGFSSPEMARIKAAYPKDSFVRACALYMQEEEGELKERLSGFFRQAEEYRRRAAYTPIHELLWQIVTETGYLDEVSALPGGEQRLANVEMLLQKAQDYEKISYHGLFHFVRYIEKLQKYRQDYGEADIGSGSGEAVRIMSIHHSKGLEFPVVFAAGLSKSFNSQESRDKCVFHSRFGAGLDFVDLENRRRRPTILKQFIRRQNLLDNLGEELRILYVAMTRAKEKLILTGMASEKLIQQEMTDTREPLLFLQLAGARCALDWLLPALNAHGSIERYRVSLEGILKDAVRGQTKRELSREELERLRLSGKRNEELYARMDACLSWEYPWNTEKGTKQKYSVTELKKLRMLEEADTSEELYPESDVIPLIPQFIEKTQEKTGAARGTVYHTVMEWMDFAGMENAEQVEEGLHTLLERGKLTEEDIRAVRPEDFLVFAKNALAERMQRAKERKELYREQPFVIGLPGREVDGSDSEELVLIQGIIDAFFYEEDGIVIVDYKTDRVRRAEELSEKYRSQLEYYAKALSMMTGKQVKERLIYSFALGKAIEV